MSNKVIVLHAEGLGNVIEIFPLLRTLKEVLGFELHFCHLFGSYSLDSLKIPYVSKILSAVELSTIDPKEYLGKIATAWVSNYISAGNLYKIPLLTRIYPIKMDESEVSVYLNVARELGAKEEDLLWEVDLDVKPAPEHFDVILANGYNKLGSANWKIKSYPYYNELVSIFKNHGLTVASIGAPLEYITGTVNMTGLSLAKSAQLIKASKCVISNDTGVYHLANVLGTLNFPIFTATSVTKNYDERFHRNAVIIRRTDLDCMPCQDRRLWNTSCQNWLCREIAPENIVKQVLMRIK